MDQSNQVDVATISKALAGSAADIEWAIEQIYRQYGQMLISVAYSRLSDMEAAKEVANEALYAVFRKASTGQWKTGIGLATFLHRVAANKAIDISRKRSRRIVCISDTQVSEHAESVSIPSESVWNKMCETEGAENFERFVSALTPKEKLVAKILGDHWLHNGRRPSVREVLDQMHHTGETGATNTSVKSLLKRVWRKMDDWNNKEIFSE